MAFYLKIFTSLSANLLVGLIYFNLFRNFFYDRLNYRFLIISFFFALASIGGASLSQYFLFFANIRETDLIKAFLFSAIPEEASKFIFIFLFFRKNDTENSVSDGIFYGLLFGGSFGIIENIIYSFELSLWPLLMRTVTSLPLHILTGGIIGGYVLRYNLSNPKNFPVIQLFKGITLCLLLHGIYNIAVFRGTESLFLIPSILTFAFIFLEYTIVKSQGALPEFVMNLIGLKLDDYEIISRFKQYDAWLRNEQNSRYQKRISMFRKMETKNKIISLVFLFAGASFLIVYLVHPENIFKFFPDITNSEVISIFVYYPIFVAFNFLFRGKLNPDFFNYRVLKVPLIGSVTLDNGQTQASSLFYFISRKGMYVPYINDEPIPGKINFTIWVAGREFKNISGNIVWSSGAESREEGETGGVFCKFDRIYFGLLLFWKLKRINHDLRNLFEAVKQKIDGRHSRRQKR